MEEPLEDHDMIMETELDEKDSRDVAIIDTPTEADKMEAEEKEPPIRADDHDEMIKRHLPKFQDLETIAEGHFTWEIESWSTLPKRITGPVFNVGDTPWRILFFPHGNNADYASLYLEHGFADKPPEDWYRCVQFALVLWNPNDPTIYFPHHAHHRFQLEEADWGFTRFYELRKLRVKDADKERSMVEDDKANITAYVRIVKDPTGVLWHNFVNYDSKKETGYVGLKNQGATCYLNSLIQSLYFTKAFRKSVYQIPTENEKTDNSALTLQRLFYLLETSNDALGTNELTKSFGWETKHIFEQQDVQELCRVLMEKLEEKMKGSEAENALAKMFVGKTKTYISCINIAFESSRIEEYWDIQLTVRGKKNLDESFRDYIAYETLEGDNKYFAEGHGLQEAKKGVIFESFPPVLHVHLKRFDYDFMRDAITKVNDLYEFPEEFDAAPYLSEDADKSEPYEYVLHGGDFNAGHYYAFIKPDAGGKWFKFDDDRVTPATIKEVLDDNFGGDIPGSQFLGPVRNPYTRTMSLKRSMSAYMLVYIRKTRMNDILPKEDYPAPSHLQKRLDEEKAVRDQKRKEREEQHLYMLAKVITNEQFKAHQGFDLATWEHQDAPSTPKLYRVLKTSTLESFVKLVASDIGQQAEKLRMWVMVNRQNKTVRPDHPLSNLDMRPDAAKVNWLESYTYHSDVQSLLFLKHFDVEAQTLRGVTHVYMKKNDKVSELNAAIINEMGWPSNTTLKIWEEIKPSMIEPMKPKQTFAQAEIQDGDIICFQRQLPEKELVSFSQISSGLFAKIRFRSLAKVPAGGYVDAKEFYDFLLNRIVMRLIPKRPQIENGTFDMELNRRLNYDQFAAKVGEHLGVPATHLRFTTVAANTGLPTRSVVKRGNNVLSLAQMLQSSYMQSVRQDALYYEILDMSLSELETKKMIKVNWLSDGITKEETVEILAPKNGVLKDVIDQLQKKINIPDEDVERVHIWESHNHKYYKDLNVDYGVAGIQDYVTLYGDLDTEDSVVRDPTTEHAIRCYHFYKEVNKTHGAPFRFVVKKGEIFKETKLRLSKRTGLRGKNFEKIKFAVVRRAVFNKPVYLNDANSVTFPEDILSDVACDADDLLGLDHADKPRPGIFGKEQSIFIR
ncbi:Ubiquitin carboxyl-terminal hydrolase [Drechslerella dactyloides]|uniref:ubiquitinyl hydrolase 1 n=1 Tax=Drechslerella dactyloides TaxID=74499 RepID=A0AAD6NFX2_DREDA|nr:Ubiquitin carboxyl-terminal hydrolase [Drechslerella dactyloides]